MTISFGSASQSSFGGASQSQESPDEAKQKASQWRPSKNDLGELLQLIAHARSCDTNHQKQVYEKLCQLEKSNEFSGYLSFIFAGGTQNATAEIRQMAGLLLRNNIKKHWAGTPPFIREVIRMAMMNTLGSSDRILRQTLGSVVSTMVTETLSRGLENWPTLFLDTAKAVTDNQNSLAHIDSVLNIWVKVVTDLEGQQLDFGDKLNPVVPVVLELLKSEHAGFRTQALELIYQFLLYPPGAFFGRIDEVIQLLFKLAQDETPRVRKNLCMCLLELTSRFQQKVDSYMEDIIKFELQCSQLGDEDIAVEATEFWTMFTQNQNMPKEKLVPFLPPLVATLLKNMVYSEEAVAEMDLANDDGNLEDRDDDIAPSTHDSKKWEAGDDSKEEESTEWNLRKASARGLDNLVNIYQGELLSSALPIIEKALQDPQWQVRESGILAIGAIGAGCARALENHLPQLIPYMMKQSADEHPLIRSMACWTTARFCQWIIHLSDPKLNLTRDFLKIALQRILDRSKQVQVAACAALAELIEAGGGELNSYATEICTTVAKALDLYKRKNQPVINDVITTLLENFPAIRDPCQDPQKEAKRRELLDPIVQRVVQTYVSVDKFDPRNFMTISTLMSCASKLGPLFTKYLEHVVPPAIDTAKKVLEEMSSAVISTKEGQKELAQRKHFLVACLDLLASIAEGQRENTPKVVDMQMVLKILEHALQDPDNYVKRACFTLIGDLYSNCPATIVDHSNVFIPLALRNLNVFFPDVCTNALWTIGEAIEALGPKFKPKLNDVINAVLRVMETDTGPIFVRRVKDNAAVIVGRLAHLDPDNVSLLAPRLKTVWINQLLMFPEDPQKLKTFYALFMLMDKNLAGFCHDVDDMARIVSACMMWRQPPDKLRTMFVTLINTIKSKVQPSDLQTMVQKVSHTVPPQLQYNLRDYGLL